MTNNLHARQLGGNPSIFITLRKDLLSKFIGEVGSRTIFIIFFFYLGRILAPAQFGSLNLALSLAGVLAVLFVDPGMNLAVVQLLVRQPESASRSVGVIFVAKLLLFLPLLVFLVLLNWIVKGRLPALPILLAAGCYACLNAILEYFSSITNAYHKMQFEALVKCLNRFLIIAMGFIALQFGRVQAVLLAMCLATLFSCLVAWYLVGRNCVSIKPGCDFAVLRDIFALGLPIAGTYICGTVYLKWDLVMLSLFKISQAQIGWYAAAFKILEALSALPGIFGAALFPMLVRLHQHNQPAFVRLIRFSSKFLLVFSMAIAVFVSGFSKAIISFLYGADYSGASPVLAIIIWSIVPMFLYFFLMSVNVAVGFARYNMWSGLVSLLVSFVTNFLLIPHFGYIGAAWAAIVANSTFAILAFWKLSSTFQNINAVKLCFQAAFPAFLMSMVVTFLPAPDLLRVATGLVVFSAGLFLVRALTKDEVFAARKLFGIPTNLAEGL